EQRAFHAPVGYAPRRTVCRNLSQFSYGFRHTNKILSGKHTQPGYPEYSGRPMFTNDVGTYMKRLGGRRPSSFASTPGPIVPDVGERSPKWEVKKYHPQRVP